MKFIYNTCFIFNKNTNTCSYEAIVKKLASDLKTLEVNNACLKSFQINNFNISDA